MPRRTRRLLIVCLLGFDLVILLFTTVYYAHAIRAFFRTPSMAGQSPRAQIDAIYPGTMTATGDCLPPYDAFDAPLYEAFMTAHDSALDSKGILLRNYGDGGNYARAGWQYAPLAIADFGVRGLRAWCEYGDRQGLEIAYRQAEWLIANADWRDGFPVWRYDFPNLPFGAPVGWTSGMSSGVAAVLFTQLHAVTGDARYRDAARDALQAFFVPTDDGGVRVEEGMGAWFEEVAHPDAPHSHILNGHMIAVKAMAYVGEYLPSDDALQLAAEGIEVVRANMYRFDGGNRTRYDLLTDTWRTPLMYPHLIHARTLWWMANRTDDVEMRQLAARWWLFVVRE